MLSISARGSAASAVGYYAHLAADSKPDAQPDDYYAKEGAGQWLGTGAATLGLTGKVSANQFQRVLEGRTPDGKDLVQGAGEKHRAGWDLTFSAPKSVSVVWGASTDTDLRATISAAHNRAVRAALDHLQNDAEAIVARRGKGGLIQEKADMVVALFQHGTSRELDPQLHTHAFVANLAQRGDGTWGCIESKAMYQWKMAAGAIYRAEFAQALAEQGLSIEVDGDSFKLAGVPDEVCQSFSKRREQIEAALAEHGASGAKASEIAALDTRRVKASDLDRDQLHARWTAEAAELGFSAEQVFAATTESALEPMPTVTEILRRATEHDAVIDEHHVWQAVAVECQHRAMGLDQIREQVAQVMQSPEIVRLIHPETGQVKYTTRELYQQERAVLAYARDHAGDKHHAVSRSKVDAALAQFAKEKGFELADEQKVAVLHVTHGAGAVRVIVGDAGTGKSTAMLATRMAWEANGQRVIGCALLSKAAAGLQKDTGIKSSSIAKLLVSLETQINLKTGEMKPPRETLTNRDVIVVDEAGMVDSRTMHRIIEHAEKAGARVVLVGDHKQLQAVGAGGVFRHLAEHDSARLTEIRRQREGWARDAVKEFSRGKAAEALGKFIDRGLVHVADDSRSAIEQAVERWHHHVSEVGMTETLLMANTNAEVAELNRAARAAMSLGPEVIIQKTDRMGRPAGKLAIAEGDRLLAKLNDKETDLKNSDFMTVRGIRFTPDGVLITARVDRTGEDVTFSPSDYAQLMHGYAVTVHAAQGATVDRAVVLGGGSMTSRESTYVQMSRMRDIAEIVITQRQIENAIDQAPPTEKMIELCESISVSKGLDLPEDYRDSFASARDWLNENSGNRIDGCGQESTLLAELKDAISAMGRSRQKETTLDYEVAEDMLSKSNELVLKLELGR